MAWRKVRSFTGVEPVLRHSLLWFAGLWMNVRSFYFCLDWGLFDGLRFGAGSGWLDRRAMATVTPKCLRFAWFAYLSDSCAESVLESFLLLP